MKKRKRVQINLSNKTYYTLLSVIALILLGVGVYATNPLGDPGHYANQIGYSDIACSEICNDFDTQELSIDGNVLSLTDGGSVNLPSGGDSDWTISGDSVYKTGRVSVGLSNWPAQFTVKTGSSTRDILNLQDYSGNEKVTVRYNGNVGIGTTSPTSKLSVGGSGSGIATIYAGSWPSESMGGVAVLGEAYGGAIYGIGVYGSGGDIGVKGYTGYSEGYSGYFTGGKGLYADNFVGGYFNFQQRDCYNLPYSAGSNVMCNEGYYVAGIYGQGGNSDAVTQVVCCR